MDLIKRIHAGILSISLISTSTPHFALALDRSLASTPSPAGTSIAEILIPGSDDVLEARFASPTPEHDRTLSPKHIRQTHSIMLEQLKADCSHRPGIIRETIQEYPSDWAAQMAGFSLAVDSELQSNPQWTESFINNSVTDGFAHATMIMFTMTNAGTEHLFRTLGFSFDQCTLLKKSMERAKLRNKQGGGNYALRAQPTRGQQLFAPFSRGFAMTAGAGVSAMAGEFLQDANVKACAKHVIGMPVKDGELACENMHEEWFVKRRISKFTPTLISTFLSTALIGLPPLAATELYNKAKAEQSNKFYKKIYDGLTKSIQMKEVAKNHAKKIGAVVRSFKIIKRGAHLIPSPRWVYGFMMEFGYEMAFWAFSKTLEPTVNQIYAKYVSRRDILAGLERLNSDIADLSKLKWSPDNRWISQGCQKGEISFFLQSPISVVKQAVTCAPEDVPAEVRNLGYAYALWRETELNEFKAAYKNWKDYASSFLKIYGYSYDFYGTLVEAVSESKATKKVSPLSVTQFSEEFLAGPTVDNPLLLKANRMAICSIKDQIKKVNADAGKVFDYATELAMREYNKPNGKAVNNQAISDKDAYEAIITGFGALDCTKPLTVLKNGARSILANLPEENTPEDLVLLEARYRLTYFARALEALDIKTRPVAVPVFPSQKYSEHLGVYDSENRRTILNPIFSEIKSILPRQLVQGAGLNFTETLAQAFKLPANSGGGRPKDSDNSKENNDKKILHPGSIYDARTNSMADYLIASMVCGAQIDLTNEEKIALLLREQGGQLGSLNEAELIKMADNYFNQRLAPDPSFFKTQSGQAGESLIVDSTSRELAFLAPRIVSRDVKYNFCKSPVRYAMPGVHFNIHRQNMTLDNKSYFGFLDLIQNKIKPELISENGTKVAFDKWWDNHVFPRSYRKALEIRKTYETLIQEKFLPALINPEIEAQNSVKMTRGIVGSIREQYTHHLNYIETTISKEDTSNTYRAFLEEKKKILNGIELIAQGLANLRNGKAILIKIEDLYVPENEKQVLEMRRAKSESRSSKQELKTIHEVRYSQAMEWIRNDISKRVEAIEKMKVTPSPGNLAINTRNSFIKNLKGVTAEIGNYVQFMAALQAQANL